MVGYALGCGGIGSGGKVEGPSDGVLLLKILQELAVIRQVDDV